MGNEVLAQEVPELFLETMSQCINELEMAIKGMAANTCAEAMRTVANEMEDAARKNDVQKAREMMSELRARFDALQTCVVNSEKKHCLDEISPQPTS